MSILTKIPPREVPAPSQNRAKRVLLLALFTDAAAITVELVTRQKQAKHKFCSKYNDTGEKAPLYSCTPCAFSSYRYLLFSKNFLKYKTCADAIVMSKIASAMVHFMTRLKILSLSSS